MRNPGRAARILEYTLNGKHCMNMRIRHWLVADGTGTAAYRWRIQNFRLPGL